MALVIPNLESSPTFDAQAIPDATDFAAELAAAALSGVIDGMTVSAQTTPNMTVQMASGHFTVNGSGIIAGALVSIPIAAASATDRKDLVLAGARISMNAGIASGTPLTSIAVKALPYTLPSGTILQWPSGTIATLSAQANAGATTVSIFSQSFNATDANQYSLTPFTVVQGTPCGTAGWSHATPTPFTNPPPVKPAIPDAHWVLLAEIYVASTTTSIAAGNIIDKTTSVASAFPGCRIVTTTTYTVNYLTDSLIIVDTTAGAATITLPDPQAGGHNGATDTIPWAGKVLTFLAFGSNPCTITPSNQSIFGGTVGTGYAINTTNAVSIALAHNNTGWWQAIGGNVFPSGTKVTPSTNYTATTAYSSGVAQQLTFFGITCPSDAMMYGVVTTAGTVTISIGSTSAASDRTIVNNSMAAGSQISFRLPQGWYFKITLTTAVITNPNTAATNTLAVVTC